ncbi:unnamed protein product [Arctia plantaginis]|uniref:Uncharacterized protein n=1 Tax=Arctia plantaginis TaxID=874455 RepID=A0A8S0ZQM3_ARCPL|nr:unnamed protein product [Arctia plantaginis]
MAVVNTTHLACYPRVAAMGRVTMARRYGAKQPGTHGRWPNTGQGNMRPVALNVPSTRTYCTCLLFLSSFEVYHGWQPSFLGFKNQKICGDDLDMERERRALAVRWNTMAPRFAPCTKQVTVHSALCGLTIGTQRVEWGCRATVVRLACLPAVETSEQSSENDTPPS